MNTFSRFFSKISYVGIKKHMPTYAYVLLSFSLLFAGASSYINNSSHTSALADGIPVGTTLWAWGDNQYGELGDGTTTNAVYPEQITGLSGAIASIQSSGTTTIALKTDGTVWTWGANYSGQLGQGTTDNNAHTAPAQVTSLSKIIAISSKNGYTLALRSDGTVWGWGVNAYGQLGNNTTTQNGSPTPTEVVAAGGGSGYLTGITAIAAGSYDAMALRSDGNVCEWGDNTYGFGNGSCQPGQYVSYPVQANITNVKAIAVDGMSLAVKSDGTLWAWGKNRYGTLGTTYSGPDSCLGIQTALNPQQVPNLSNIISVQTTGAFDSYFGEYAYAEGADGTMWDWYGAVQNYGHQAPQQDTNFGTGIATVSPSTLTTDIVKSNGTIWVAGFNNQFGQFGNGTTNSNTTYTQIAGLTHVQSVNMTGYSNFALTSL